jgi:hypothetical protein
VGSCLVGSCGDGTSDGAPWGQFGPIDFCPMAWERPFVTEDGNNGWVSMRTANSQRLCGTKAGPCRTMWQYPSDSYVRRVRTEGQRGFGRRGTTRHDWTVNEKSSKTPCALILCFRRDLHASTSMCRHRPSARAGVGCTGTVDLPEMIPETGNWDATRWRLRRLLRCRFVRLLPSVWRGVFEEPDAERSRIRASNEARSTKHEASVSRTARRRI